MRRFTNILFTPLGEHDNPAAIRRVVDLARRNEGRVTLLGVVPEPSRRHRMLHRGEIDAAIASSQRLDMMHRLQRWCKLTDEMPIDIDVRVGNAALCIIGRALAGGHDLVVVTSDEDRDDHATIKRLLRKCPVPVWVIRPTRARIQRVLVSVDPEPDEQALNQLLLELGASMVELYGGELHLLHAWELWGEATMRSSAFASVPADEVDRLLAAERGSRDAAVHELVMTSTVAGAPWEVHLIKGPPGHVIPDYVRTHRINLLVMGTVARTGLSGLIMGNTAEQVLDNVGCSVIAVKPAGFVSPIADETSH